jgi:hypothetical protein
VILIADGFSSESPDEETLVSPAATFCAKFVSRIPGRSIFVELVGAETEYDHLATVQVDSDGKRMSALGMCYCTRKVRTRRWWVCAQRTKPRRLQGLRTLVCGFRVVLEEEWTDFKARLDLATANGTGGRLARQSSTIWLCWG